ncbi:hypothetical protein AU509_05205 [Lonsdalea britannica]|nr:hypothetical protein AU509_05205 [Lonsdalea britannica]
MKIEHWACQHDHPELELSYKNMLGCCMGNEGKPKNLQTCDTRKGSDCIKFNPSEPNHHVNDLIKFHGDGKIYSTDSEFNIQLVKVLNLNSDRLVRNRTLLIDSIRKELNAKKGKRTKSEIKKLIAVYLEVDTDGKLKEYYALPLITFQQKFRKLIIQQIIHNSDSLEFYYVFSYSLEPQHFILTC